MSDPTVTTDPYARIAAVYDLEHDAFADDIAFYLQSIEVVGDPVLELGCGSGRLVRPIAKAGWRITGLDRSGAMLDRLRASIKRERYRERITLSKAEMTEAAAAPGGPFGVVIFSLNGLMHLTTPIDQMAALRAAHAALDARGQLIIDLMNPALDTLREYDGRVAHEETWTGDHGATIDKFSVRRLSSSDQLIHTRVWYDETADDGSIRRAATAFDLRFLYRHELELMLEMSGFTDWRFYGGYELEPFDDAAERMLVTAEVAPE